MEPTITYVTLIAGLVTITWFIRDVRKQNSKSLKSIDQTQMKQSEILLKIEEGQRKGFAVLDQGQRKGFAALDQGQITLAKILERIEKSSEATAKILERIEKSSEATAGTLERIQKSSEATVKSSETQTKILDKILTKG